MMQAFWNRLTQGLLRRWRMLLVLIGGAALAAPQLWAWYHWHAAQVALDRCHGSEAHTHLEVCRAIWPWSSSARICLLSSRAARLTGAYDEAEQRLHDCQRLLQGESPETTLEWALLKVTMGDMGEKGEYEDYLSKHARQVPSHAPLVWEALAEGYLRMSRILDALNVVDRWLQQQPDSVPALFLRGNVWWQVGSAQKYVPDYRRVVELDPGHLEARRRLAIGLVEIGRYEEALPHLENLRLRQPDDLEVLVRLARCRSGLGQVAKARQILDDVLARQPEHGQALRTYGQISLQAGEPAEAERWLRQAVRALPNDYPAQWSLYQALQQEGKEVEAGAQLKRAEHLKERRERLAEISHRLLSIRPHDPALHCELGTLLIGLGDRELGERWLLSALHEDEHYRPACVALADYYQAQGNLEEAAFYREKAQQNPEH